MIIIHPLKIAYQQAPKLGTTSLFLWLHEILDQFEFVKTGPVPSPRQWFLTQNSDIVENVDLSAFNPPDDYFKFCVVRDPLKRFVSAYRNRVMGHGELNVTRKGVRRLLTGGLKASPEINILVENMDTYQDAVRTIRHHTLPMVSFLGRDPSIYTQIFDIRDMGKLRDSLIQHWKNSGIDIDLDSVPAIPHEQILGPKIGIEILNKQSVDTLLDYYKEDYQTFPMLSISSAVEEWNRLRTEAPATVQQVKQIRNRCDGVIEARLRKPIVADPDSGRLDELMGVVVLRQDISKRGRLLLQDAHGTTMLNWRPSPKVALRHPGNPNAKNARFTANDVRIRAGKPVRILWQNGTNKKAHIVLSIKAVPEPAPQPRSVEM